MSSKLWKPLPGPQSDAYYCLADELFYGGAAGGGKTHLALGLAITQHENSIIFRREYKQLRDIIRDSHKLLDGHAHWNGSDLTWSGIPGGHLIDFGAVQHAKKQAGWMGRPHDLIVLDEGSQLTESTYLFLSGWLRTTTPTQRTRVLLCSNPPTTSEGEWVIRRWAPWLDASYPNPAMPGELRWYARPDDVDTPVDGPEPFEYTNKRGVVEILHPRSRTFIPAHLSDNPYLNTDDAYLATLQSLPEPYRSQLLYGDFSIGLQDDPWQVIPTEWAKAAMRRWHEWAADGKQGRFEGMGVDVGRHHDKTVFAMRYGNAIDELRRYSQQSTMAAVGMITGILDASPSAYCNPDETGVGTGLVDRLFELGYKRQVIPFVAGAKTERRTKDGTLGFSNRRSMGWWTLRELLDPNALTDPVMLPDDPELLGDLCSLRYNIASDGKIQVEAKDKLIERLGRSPDAGDAVMQAFAPPEKRGTFIV